MRTGNRATRYKKMPMIEIHMIKPLHNRVHNSVHDGAYNRAHDRAYNRTHDKAHDSEHDNSNSHDGICTRRNSHTIEYAHDGIRVLKPTRWNSHIQTHTMEFRKMRFADGTYMFAQ